MERTAFETDVGTHNRPAPKLLQPFRPTSHFQHKRALPSLDFKDNRLVTNGMAQHSQQHQRCGA
jgi:hypothetical protein